MKYEWNTNRECRFLDNLGNYSGKRKMIWPGKVGELESGAEKALRRERRLRLLRNYRDSMDIRDNWCGMAVGDIRSYCMKLIDRMSL